MTSTPDLCGNALAPDEIRGATERVTASDVFSRSPQLGAFLRFVVEASLCGKADRIKAYTIGVEVLRRDTSFDPQLDPIVRVEATRLRRAIERYYTGAGANDPVIIDLPRGSYVPTFRRREIESRHVLPAVATLGRWTAHLHQPATVASVAVLAAIAIVAIAVLVIYTRQDSRALPVSVVAARDLDSGLRAAAVLSGNGMPVVQIEPLRVIGAAAARDIVPERLQAKISDAFARFDTINVASNSVAADPTTPASAAERVDYRLSGSVEYGGHEPSAWFTLTSVAEGKVVWSKTFDHVRPLGSEGLTEDGIVISLTNSLLQSYGVIRARDRANQLASSAGDPRYRCVLEAADAIRTGDRDTHDRARDCLERLTSLDPGFAVGFTFLALIYNREFQSEYPLRPGDAPPLDRALAAVRQSLALHPENSRGYLALMVVQSNRRDMEASLAAGDKCVSFNKYDMLALGEYGGRLVFSGEVEKGMQMLRQSEAYGAVRPPWHNVYLFVGSYMVGDFIEAVRYANDIPNDNLALGQVARALVANLAGDQPAVRKALDRLTALGPGWARDPRAELARLIPNARITERLARDLAAAGLPGGA